MRLPHELEPVRLGYNGLNVEDVFGELPYRTPEWFASAYARTLLTSTGPLWIEHPEVPLERAIKVRLERARIEVVAHDVDHDKARMGFWPTLGEVSELALGVGSPAPRLVAVGFRDPSRTKSDPRPWLSPGGFWLFRALREFGYDELSLYLLNAFSGDGDRKERIGKLVAVFAQYEPTWVALGRDASTTLSTMGVEHVQVWSPAWHRKRCSEDGRVYAPWTDHRKVIGGPGGYAKHLDESGVPPGPWYSGDRLPTVKTDDVPELVDVLGLPHTVAHRPESRGGGATFEPADMARVEDARRAYVTGECSSIADAARRIGVPAVRLYKWAKKQGWEVERDRYREDVRKRFFAETAQAEVRSRTTARRGLWAAANFAIKSVATRLQPDETGKSALVPNVAEACMLVRTAQELSEVSDPTVDRDRESLNERPWPGLALELAKTLNDQFKLGAIAADETASEEQTTDEDEVDEAALQLERDVAAGEDVEP